MVFVRPNLRTGELAYRERRYYQIITSCLAATSLPIRATISALRPLVDGHCRYGVTGKARRSVDRTILLACRKLADRDGIRRTLIERDRSNIQTRKRIMTTLNGHW